MMYVEFSSINNVPCINRKSFVPFFFCAFRFQGPLLCRFWEQDRDDHRDRRDRGQIYTIRIGRSVSFFFFFLFFHSLAAWLWNISLILAIMRRFSVDTPNS